MPLILPLEIEETILNYLAESEGPRHATTKTCSLVCRAFLPICRKHIFRSIALINRNWEEDVNPLIHAFVRLLRETPEIADYIRNLNYNVRGEDCHFKGTSTSESIQLEESFKRISKLKSLTIWNHYYLEFCWDDNPIRSGLLHLLHLPTLTDFKMNRIDYFIVHDLIPCVNLKYLDIGVHSTVADYDTFPAALPGNSIQLDEFESGIGTSDLIMELCSAQRFDGLPIIDFRSLSKLKVNPELPNEGEPVASWELLSRCQALTDVHLSFSDPRNVRPSLADMLRPFMQTLKNIVLDIEVGGVDVDPLFDIPSELENMRTKNIIETFDIQVRIPTDGNCRRGDEWGRLDEVLTAPGWFSSLKRFSMAIEINTFDRTNEDDELEVALRKLPETQLLRLSSSKTILFSFVVNLAYVPDLW